MLTPRAVLGSIMLLAGLAAPALAQGLVEFEVSPALQETWSSSITALPGQQLDVRIKVSHIDMGEEPPIGLGSILLQPSFSNWDNTGPSRDTLLPFVNGGGALSSPVGQVPDQPGLYGRITPFGDRTPGPNPFIGHVNTVGSTTYLRIAQSHITSWIDGPGNTGGGGGVIIGQLPFPIVPSHPDYPPFNHALSNVVVMKLGITLSADQAARVLQFGAAEGFASQAPNLNTLIKWFANEQEVFLGSIQGTPTYLPATINVIPAPAAAAGLIALLAMRRPRR